MAGKVRVIVLSGNGINCESETAHACRLGGAEIVELVHINELLAGDRLLKGYHLLCLPGGFLDGDDLGAAKACANRFRHARIAATGERFWEHLVRFIEEGGLILGICNGFQLLAKLGLVPALAGRGVQEVTLTYNDSGRFEDRWVHLMVDPLSPCVFTRGIERLYLPVRHGEGKFLPADPKVAAMLKQQHLAPLTYTDEGYSGPTMQYPQNPNGSIDGVAGVCDTTGRVFGLMPHPEAYTDRTHHPRWTREVLPEEGEGVALFRNAVDYIKGNIL